MKFESGRRVFVVAMVALVSISCGFVAGWGASRRLSTRTYTDIERAYLTEPGDAPAEVRAEVTDALRAFQDGYLQRDPQRLESFMQLLFPKDQHLLVAGTETGEWRQGYDSVTRFIRDDWLKWGDVRLNVNEAVVCASGDVAWITTVGTVGAGTSARPIRFSAVMSRTGGRWLFRHIQFQWDVGGLAFSDLLRPNVLARVHVQ